MLLDEPFSALDTGLRADTRRAVADLLAASGIATILVTHDQAEALSFADQLAVMRGGRLVQIGPPRALYLRPRDAEVATFLGDAVLLPAEVAEGWADCILGRIAVDDPDQRGRRQVMLRPEQLSMVPRPTSGAGRGLITAIEFGGAVCQTRIALIGADGARHPAITLRSAATDQACVGDTVGLRVRGTAHVLP